MFDGSIKNSSNLSFDSWFTDRNSINPSLDFQVDIGSAQIVNSPKCLLVAHQSLARVGVPNKRISHQFLILSMSENILQKSLVKDILKNLLALFMLELILSIIIGILWYFRSSILLKSCLLLF